MHEHVFFVASSCAKKKQWIYYQASDLDEKKDKQKLPYIWYQWSNGSNAYVNISFWEMDSKYLKVKIDGTDTKR